ncbi:MAG: hypothetical protein JWM27_96 [Gemmatimonadetes bacterium]|nr:hypothetical protein [Gemmatimonadota bacterium]
MPTITQKELAGHLGITTRQVRTLTGDGVLVPVEGDPRKGYPWPAANRAYISFKQQEAVARAARDTADADTFELEKRKLAAQVKREEIKAEAEAGNSVPLAIHEREIDGVFTSLRTALDRLPGQGAMRILHLESRAEAQDKLRELVEELKEGLRGAFEAAVDEAEAEGAGGAVLRLLPTGEPDEGEA